MRTFASLVVLVTLTSCLAACNCCPPRDRCAPVPVCGCEGQNVPPCPVVGAACPADQWPNFAPTSPAGAPTAATLLNDIEANANQWLTWLQDPKHAMACQGASGGELSCEIGWGAVVAEVNKCRNKTAQHSDSAAGNDHFDSPCLKLYSDLKKAKAASAFTDDAAGSAKWQACLTELNHEDGPMLTRASAPSTSGGK